MTPRLLNPALLVGSKHRDALRLTSAEQMRAVVDNIRVYRGMAFACQQAVTNYRPLDPGALFVSEKWLVGTERMIGVAPNTYWDERATRSQPLFDAAGEPSIEALTIHLDQMKDLQAAITYMKGRAQDLQGQVQQASMTDTGEISGDDMTYGLRWSEQGCYIYSIVVGQWQVSMADPDGQLQRALSDMGQYHLSATQAIASFQEKGQAAVGSTPQKEQKMQWYSAHANLYLTALQEQANVVQSMLQKLETTVQAMHHHQALEKSWLTGCWWRSNPTFQQIWAEGIDSRAVYAAPVVVGPLSGRRYVCEVAGRRLLRDRQNPLILSRAVAYHIALHADLAEYWLACMRAVFASLHDSAEAQPDFSAEKKSAKRIATFAWRARLIVQDEEARAEPMASCAGSMRSIFR